MLPEHTTGWLLHPEGMPRGCSWTRTRAPCHSPNEAVLSVCRCPCAHSRSKRLVFTRRHENERFSSSPYSGVNLVEAPVDFDRFSADNESLVDAVCTVNVYMYEYEWSNE